MQVTVFGMLDKPLMLKLVGRVKPIFGSKEAEVPTSNLLMETTELDLLLSMTYY
jgi:hypothetical protein